MQAETLLSFPHGVAIPDYPVITGTLHLVLAATAPFARCPMCRTASSAQHSHSQRSVRDVPCGGYPLRLLLRTRRFFCRQQGCARRICTQRFPAFLLPRARMTERFREALLALRATTAHEAAQRLASLLHLPTSVATLRRQLGRQPPPDVPVPTTIGIADCAFRTRKRYGTVIVDLDSHRIVDLLADRTSATVEAWLGGLAWWPGLVAWLGGLAWWPPA